MSGASEWTSELPNTYVWILDYSGPQCSIAKEPNLPTEMKGKAPRADMRMKSFILILTQSFSFDVTYSSDFNACVCARFWRGIYVAEGGRMVCTRDRVLKMFI